jgi:hypothetical protein
VEAMKLVAFHYVNKPFDVEEIVLLAEKALEACTESNLCSRESRRAQHRRYCLRVKPAPARISRPSCHRRSRPLVDLDLSIRHEVRHVVVKPTNSGHTCGEAGFSDSAEVTLQAMRGLSYSGRVA